MIKDAGGLVALSGFFRGPFWRPLVDELLIPRVPAATPQRPRGERSTPLRFKLTYSVADRMYIRRKPTFLAAKAGY
jgi:hypothetical protein